MLELELDPISIAFFVSVIKLFKADKKFDDYIYLFKHPVVYYNNLLIGSDNGEILIYDLKKNITQKKMKIISSPISTSIYQFSFEINL